MTASEAAKRAGLNSLAEVAKLTKPPGTQLNSWRGTLTNWHKSRPELFAIVLLGCAAKLDRR